SFCSENTSNQSTVTETTQITTSTQVSPIEIHLTVRHSGPMGRLGNHMFQYAVVRAINILYGHQIYWTDPLLSKTFKNILHHTNNIGENEIQVAEQGFEYFEINPNGR